MTNDLLPVLFVGAGIILLGKIDLANDVFTTVIFKLSYKEDDILILPVSRHSSGIRVLLSFPAVTFGFRN